VVSAVVAKEQVENVSGEPQAAVIVDSLNGGEGEEENASARSHAREKEREGTPHGVKKKALQWMIVQSTKRVGDYKSVVLGMDVLVQELVQVHVSMYEVLPCVQHHHGHGELQSYDEKRRLWFGDIAVVADDSEEEEGDGDLESLLNKDASQDGGP